MEFSQKPWVLNSVAGICGAVTMVLELVGSRVIAPFLGTSVFVWTSLIGVILACLSMGYWYGGSRSDRYPTAHHLSRILLLAGLATLSVIFFRPLLLALPALQIDIRLTAPAVAIILFGPATFCLGMVTPYLARLSLHSLGNSGKTVGQLYAISTVGSIVGTFLGGFVLISFFKLTTIFIGMGLLLLMLGVGLAQGGRRKSLTLSAVALVGILPSYWLPFDLPLLPGQRLILDQNSPYHRFWVVDQTDATTRRPTRIITDSIYGEQSGAFRDDPDELLFAYTKALNLGPHLVPDFSRMLLVGAGGFSYPKHIIRAFPDKQLDVVEIDPELTSVAREYFSYRDSPNVHIYHEDGRGFLRRTTSTYDIVVMDAFLSNVTIPFHLTTREALRDIQKHLSPNGVVVANLIGSFEGDRSEFFRAELKTYQAVFPRTAVFQVKNRLPGQVQNILLVAFNHVVTPSLPSSEEELRKFVLREWKVAIPTDDVRILEDDFAPVEYYNRKALLR